MARLNVRGVVRIHDAADLAASRAIVEYQTAPVPCDLLKEGGAGVPIGRGVATPIGQLWASALMLEHLGETAAAARLMAAVERVTAAGIVTPDLGGRHRTDEVVDAMVAACAAAEADR